MGKKCWASVLTIGAAFGGIAYSIAVEPSVELRGAMAVAWWLCSMLWVIGANQLIREMRRIFPTGEL